MVKVILSAKYSTTSIQITTDELAFKFIFIKSNGKNQKKGNRYKKTSMPVANVETNFAI